MARKKWTAEQLVDATIQHKMDITEFDGKWDATCAEAYSEDEPTLERAVYNCAKKVEALVQEEIEAAEKKERAEYERLKAKYG